MFRSLLCLFGHRHVDVLDHFPVVIHQGHDGMYEGDEDPTLRIYRTKCSNCSADKLWVFGGSILELPWNNNQRWPNLPHAHHTFRPATPDDILVLVQRIHDQQFGPNPYNKPAKIP